MNMTEVMSEEKMDSRSPMNAGMLTSQPIAHNNVLQRASSIPIKLKQPPIAEIEAHTEAKTGVKRKSASVTPSLNKRPKFQQDSTSPAEEALIAMLSSKSGFLNGEELINLSLVSKGMYSACSATPLWAYVSLRVAETLRGHLGSVNVLTTLKNWAFSGSNDGKIKLWDLEKWDSLKTIQMSQSVYSKHVRQPNRAGSREVSMPSGVTALEAVGEYLFTGLEEGEIAMNILVRKDQNSSHTKREPGHSGRVNCLKAVGDRLFSAGNDGKISVFVLRNLEPIKQLRPYHKRAIIGLEVCCQRLFSGSEDGNVMVWDITNDKVPLIAILTPPGVNFQIPYPHQPNTIKLDMTHSQKISSMCCFQNKLYTSGWDCILKLWDCQTLTLLKKVFLTPLSICWTMQVRETSQLKPHLLCAVRDGEIELRDIDDLLLMHGTTGPKCNWSKGINGHESWINTILCLKDGRIITGSDDWTLKVWHIRNSEHDKRFNGLLKQRNEEFAKKKSYLDGLVSGNLKKKTDNSSKPAGAESTDKKAEEKTKGTVEVKQEANSSAASSTSAGVTSESKSATPEPKKEVRI